ncbi:hypothetical protein [Embleya sp. NBC_00896]|nr:hypothetical protein OG928_14085 [Embleya sp. NBC_00896]
MRNQLDQLSQLIMVAKFDEPSAQVILAILMINIDSERRVV